MTYVENEDVFFREMKDDPQTRRGIDAPDIEYVVLGRAKPSNLVSLTRLTRFPTDHKRIASEDGF